MRHGALLQAVVLSTLAVFLTGCSRNPVAPTVDPSAGPGAGTTIISQIPDDPPVSEGGSPNSRTVSFTATSEGSVTVGRFTLWLRKNSLKMPATITLHVTDPEAMTVQIDVQPAAANNFKQPVLLTADMSDVASVDYGTATMLYWDGAWEPGADVAAHPNQQNIVGHFTSLSNCKVTDGSSSQNRLSE